MKNNIVITILALALLPIGIVIGQEYNQIKTGQAIAAYEQTALEQQASLYGSIMRETALRESYIQLLVKKAVSEPVYFYVTPNQVFTNVELDRAFAHINFAIRVHSLYAKEPTRQTRETGNTTWNLEKVEDYQLIKRLLEVAYGGGK